MFRTTEGYWTRSPPWSGCAVAQSVPAGLRSRPEALEVTRTIARVLGVPPTVDGFAALAPEQIVAVQDSLRLAKARLTDVDFTQAVTLGIDDGIDALRGATITSTQLIDLAAGLAASAGVIVQP